MMNSNEIQVQLKNHAMMVVVAEPGIQRELQGFFSFYAPNYKFMPKYKSGVWDGKIRLYNLMTYELGVGLYPHLCKFALDRGYTVKVVPVQEYGRPGERNNITVEDIREFEKTLNLPWVMHDYQVDAVLQALTWNRQVLKSPTASGKSLIIYVLMRWYMKHETEKKILIVVPTIGLVTQMAKDFVSYGFDVKKCHAIFAGQDKLTKKQIIISTWQSIYKLPSAWFDKFFCIFGDECHGFQASSLSSIMNKAKNTKYRIGTTGTLDGTTVNKLVLESLFGPVYNVTTTKALQEAGTVADLKIRMIHLSYPKIITDNIPKKFSYKDEIKFLTEYKPRNDFIVNLALSLKGNTLILFRFVETHGEVLYKDILTKKGKKRKAFYIHGKTDMDDREAVRGIVASQEDAIINASLGVFSTGINIPEIHNCIFANPMKGQIKVLQSIGRTLRKVERGSRLFDIVDDLMYTGKSKPNYSMQHGLVRRQIYQNEGFNFTIDNIRLEHI